MKKIIILSLLSLSVISCKKETYCVKIIEKSRIVDGNAVVYTLYTSQGIEQVYTLDDSYEVNDYYCKDR
jgi:hypothetical protein